MLTKTAEQFIWNVLRLGLLEHESKQAIDSVASMYEKRTDLPAKLESALAEYGSSGDRTKLFALALTVLRDFDLEADHRTHLAARLFAKNEIDVDQAYSFLAFDGVKVDDLQPSVRRIADILWLLRQDADARVMGPKDDNLLSEALRSLANERLPAE